MKKKKNGARRPKMKRVYSPDDGAVTLKGYWYADLYGPDGKLKEHREGKNIVTTNGKEFLASLLSSIACATATQDMRYIAIGTGTAAESAAQTALTTEVARVTGTVSYTSGAIYEVRATFATGVGTGAITEYGLFNSAASSTGTMLTRDLESVINKGASDTLAIVHQLTFS
jgi:hypothetical protein